MEELFKSHLPQMFQNKIERFTEKENGFSALVRANCKNPEEASSWIIEYGKLSLTKWNVRRNYKSERLAFRKDWICHLTNWQHVSKNGPRSKARSCSAKIIFKIKDDTKDTRKNDSHIKDGLLSVIEIDSVHSHPIENAHALSFLKADENVRKRFYQLFDDGYMAAEAAHYIRAEIDLETDGDEIALADASRVPSMRTVSYWYDLWRTAKYGKNSIDNVDLDQVLKEKIATYESAGTTVAWNSDSQTIVVITPIMKRAHNLHSSSEIVFVDSTGACDAQNHVLTFLFTMCAAGAVPLGICITNGKSTQKYEAAFRLLNNALGAVAFNGQGSPEYFMTDDDDAEREALKRVWPNSNRLLCLFHVSQSIWRWLWLDCSKIKKNDRPILMKMFSKIIYATSEEEAMQLHQSLITSEIGKRYSKWLAYVDTYWERRELWCLAYRKSAALRGNHTNNYCESSIRLFKDIVLSRTKAYNQIALIDFIIMVMEPYYQRRLLEFAHSRNTKAYLLLDRVLKAAATIKLDDIQSIEDGFFYVKSQSGDDYYYVDAEAGKCSCTAGMFGSFCKHQAALYSLHKIRLPNAPSISMIDRFSMAVLAKGENVRRMEFYADLTECVQEGFADVSCTRTDVYSSINEESETANLIEEHMEIEPTANESSASALGEKANEVAALILETIAKFGNGAGESNLIGGLDKFLSRLKNVRNSSQLTSFFHTCGSGVVEKRKLSRGNMYVQPTTPSRRRPTLPHGRKPLAAGRPAGSKKTVLSSPSKTAAAKKVAFAKKVVTTKRRRCLALNVENNRPNAKTH